MSTAESLNRAALDQIDKTVRAMALRPGMYGDALAVECQARLALSLRRTLLGAEPDAHGSFAKHFESVYGGLILDWFGVVSVGASAFLKDAAIGPFVAELYYREQQKVPDPKGPSGAIEGRVLFWSAFLHLQDDWRIGTGGLSNPHKRIAHPSYRAIVALGWPVVRPILRSFVGNADPEMWAPALREITGENPVPKAHAGNLRKIAKDWLAWGEERGYVFRRRKASPRAAAAAPAHLARTPGSRRTASGTQAAWGTRRSRGKRRGKPIDERA